MPNYKLYYFDSKGRAETIRWIFEAAGVKYVDERLSKDQWLEFKPRAPFGQMPCLEVDGKMMCQGNSICRHLAKKYGFAGKDDNEAFRVDMIVDCIDDMVKPLYQMFFNPDEASKAAAKTKWTEEQQPAFFRYFEKFLEENKSGYFVGSKMTWADMAFVHVLSFLEKAGKPDFTKYPKIKELVDKVTKNPKIAAWIARRPETEY